MNFNLISHRREVIEAMETAKLAALEAVGSQCAGYASMLAPHDTGRLRNSITWATKLSEGRSFSYRDDLGNFYTDSVGIGVPEDSVCVGTNVEYAVYQEMGTSKVAAQPYLRPAVENHLNEYKKIMSRFLKGSA